MGTVQMQSAAICFRRSPLSRKRRKAASGRRRSEVVLHYEEPGGAAIGGQHCAGVGEQVVDTLDEFVRIVLQLAAGNSAILTIADHPRLESGEELNAVCQEAKVHAGLPLTSA